MEDEAPLILVVEDETSIRFLVTDTLVDEGYRVVAAPEGRSALNLVADGTRPDLIILDKRMPVLDGLGFIQEYRKQAADTAPVLMLSASVSLANVPLAPPLVGYLKKPFDIDELLSTVQRVLA